MLLLKLILLLSKLLIFTVFDLFIFYLLLEKLKK